MFPISTDTLYILGFSAFFAFAALCFVLTPQKRWLLWLSLALFLALVLALLPYTKVGYAALGNILVIIALGVLLLGAAVWAIGLHFTFKKWLPRRYVSKYALAIAPPAAVSVMSLLSQYVPAASCRDTPLPIMIADNPFVLPPTREALLRLEPKEPNSNRQFDYSRHRDHKADLRALCRLADGGETPLTVTEAWFTDQPFEKTAAQLFSSQKIMILRDSHFTREMYGGSYFDMHNLARLAGQSGVFTRGDDNNGALCRNRGDTDNRYCRVWFRLSPDVRIKASRENISPLSDAEALAALELAMDELLKELAP